jgi:hypothetical protein
VNLPVIEELRPPFRKISVLDEKARVGVTFDAMVFNKPYAGFNGLAEAVIGVAGDSDDGAFQT